MDFVLAFVKYIATGVFALLTAGFILAGAMCGWLTASGIVDRIKNKYKDGSVVVFAGLLFVCIAMAALCVSVVLILL